MAEIGSPFAVVGSILLTVVFPAPRYPVIRVMGTGGRDGAAAGIGKGDGRW